MILFHADLDNTLIYSHRHDIGQDKTCVEIYQGREVSFMTGKTQALLRQAVKGCVFVPTTTRTQEQYARIQLGVGTPPLALVCNGGVLLRDGREDGAWYADSLARIASCREELSRAVQILAADPDRTFEVRLIRDLFVFTKSARPEASAQRLAEVLDLSCMEVFRNGVKVYAVPRALSKGEAVRRLRAQMKPDRVLAAGDSAFDLPMLAQADVSFAPVELELGEETGNVPGLTQLEGKRPFSEQLLEHVLEELNR